MNVQNTSGAAASSSNAIDFVSQHLDPHDNVWVVGDLDTHPSQYFNSNPALNAFPSAYAVRISDMTVIADQGMTNYYLPFVDIATDPTADWSNPPAPTIPFVNNCGDGDEEATEPNNDPTQATPISAGEYTGGICDESPDFYQISTEGDWTVTVTYTQATGDIDMDIIDPATGSRAKDDAGNDLVSEDTTGQEQIAFHGPALLRVYGYNGASAPYSLSLQ